MEVIDAIINDGKLCVLTRYYDSSLRMKVFETHVYECENFEKIDKYYFNYTLTEDPIKMAKDSKNNIYVATSDYDQATKAYVNKLYKLSKRFSKELIGTYQYTKKAHANLVDFKISTTGEIILLYNLVDLSLENPYGYLYQIIDDEQTKAEIEDFSSTSYVEGLIDVDELLFLKDQTIVIDKIDYAIFTDLQKEISLDAKQQLTYPIVYINGSKKTPNLTKSQINYDRNVFGTYQALY